MASDCQSISMSSLYLMVMVAPFEWTMLVVRADVPEPDVPSAVFDVDVACSCHCHDMQHMREVGRNVAMCLRPDGLVVAEFDKAASLAVERSTD